MLCVVLFRINTHQSFISKLNRQHVREIIINVNLSCCVQHVSVCWRVGRIHRMASFTQQWPHMRALLQRWRFCYKILCHYETAWLSFFRGIQKEIFSKLLFHAKYINEGCQAPKMTKSTLKIVHMTCAGYFKSSEGIWQLKWKAW